MQAHLLMPYPSKSSSMGGAPSSSGGAEQQDGYASAAGGAAAGAVPAVQAPIRSIYALAVNAAGTVVGVGTTDTHIRLLDPRTGDKVMKLKVWLLWAVDCNHWLVCSLPKRGGS